MRHGLLLLVVAFVITSVPVFARYEVEVTDTYPSGNDINLGLDEPYRIQISYKTDEPIRIWARPFYQGSKVDTTSNASEQYTGEGEALGWFSSRSPVEIDEVRLFVGASGGRGQEAASYPVKIHIGGGAAPLESEPAWVSTLVDQTNRAQMDSLKQQANQPITAADTALMFGLMAAVFGLSLGGLIIPIIAWRRWDGGWKVAAAVPVCLMGFVILRIIFGVMIDPTSHNLWPFELIMFGIVSLVIITVMKIAKLFMHGRADA